MALCSSENLTLEEIQSWSLDFLSDYKTPRNLKILEELPKNAMGKVVKPEIKKLFYQKYDRQNIEELITNFFCVPKFRENNFLNNNKINKITLFPLSHSPLRTMTIDLLNHIIEYFYQKKEIEIILDNQSKISNFNFVLSRNCLIFGRVSVINYSILPPATKNVEKK